LLSIFKDRNRLSPRYIPPSLPHREEQLQALMGVFEDSLERIAECYLRTVQVFGGVGAGKTSTVLRFGERFQEMAQARRIDLRHVYVNLKLQNSGRVILYRHLLERAAPEIKATSLSADEMLYQLVKYLKSRGKYLLLTLDEVEYYVRHTKERILYDLTRMNELAPEGPCGVIGLVLVSRNSSFHSLLDPSELSTLGRTTIEFPQYSMRQVRDILDARLKEAFQKGVVSEDILAYVADVTARPPVNSDVRYALDLLLYAGSLAERQGISKILPEHVRHVHSAIHHQITSDDIAELPHEEKLVLLAVARALRSRKTPYVTFSEIQESYDLVVEEYEMNLRSIDHLLQDLSDRGIIQVESLTRIGIGDMPIEMLIRQLNDVLGRPETALGESCD
jgi:cell division control protein 6